MEDAPWDRRKVFLRVTKHALFFLVSLGITHLFLAYFISVPEVWRLMTTAPTANWGIFVFVFVATGVLYFNFAWFREQLCIIICPYGRLQSALIDDNSMVIGYDENRGEPRGKVSAKDAGDCIDCNRCVAVCPTGCECQYSRVHPFIPKAVTRDDSLEGQNPAVARSGDCLGNGRILVSVSGPEHEGKSWTDDGRVGGGS